MKTYLLISIALLFFAGPALATDFMANARVFVGSNSVNPIEVNSEMTNLNLKQFSSLLKYGVEITVPAGNYFDFGLRSEHIDQKNLENTVTAGHDYNATLTQDSVMGVARIHLFKSDVIVASVFAAGGIAKTQLSELTPTQDGQLASSGFNTMLAEAGLSVGVGYKKVFFFVEGGTMSNKVDSGLQTTGNLNDNIKTIDLSGSFVLIGLVFNGVMANK